MKKNSVYLCSSVTPGTQADIISEAIDKNPADVDALYGLALTQERLGLTDEAIRTFQRALKHAPNDDDIIRDLGIACFRTGQTGDAIRYLSRSLSINRNDENTIIYLGRAHASAGNFQESLKILKLLENKTSIETDARYHLAMAYGKIGDQGMSHYHFGLFFKENKRRRAPVFISRQP